MADDKKPPAETGGDADPAMTPEQMDEWEFDCRPAGKGLGLSDDELPEDVRRAMAGRKDALKRR